MRLLLHAYDTLAEVPVTGWTATVALNEVYESLQYVIEMLGAVATVDLDNVTRHRLARGIDMTCRYCGVYMDGHHEGTCPVRRAEQDDECPYCEAREGEAHADRCPLFAPDDLVPEDPEAA